LTVERDDATPYWNDLGSRRRIREQYFKAYPVCRWAQPAIEAALTLRSTANVSADAIEEIAIETFAEAAALGAGCAIPNATDEAQYSLPHPVAAALVFGQVGAEEIELPRLADPRIRHLLAAMKVIEDAEFSRRFPAERWARVRITLKNGRMLASEPAIAHGNPENPSPTMNCAANIVRWPSRCLVSGGQHGSNDWSMRCRKSIGHVVDPTATRSCRRIARETETHLRLTSFIRFSSSSKANSLDRHAGNPALSRPSRR
jgi:hypothetical protein